MKFLTRRCTLLAALAVVGVVLLAPAVQAQSPRVRYGRAFLSAQDRYPAFVPTQLQRSMFYWQNYQARVMARTYASFPPWVYGYNPYPQVVNYGPVYPYVTPQTYANPYTMNPYMAYPTYVNPYNTYVAPFPYGVNPYGY